MARNPRSLSQSPRPLDIEDPRDDVLADIIGAALLRNAIYRRIECRAPWGMRLPQHDRATFYVVARGGGRLEVEGEPVVELSGGDVVLLPHGTPHVFRDAHASKPIPICDGKHSPPGAAVHTIGGAGAPTSLIAGFFSFRARKPTLLAALPRVVTLSSTAPQPWIPTIIQLLIAESASPGPASVLVLQRLADVLLVHALRALSLPHCPRQGIGALGEPAIHQALGLMHASVTHPWTVGTLAARVGLSRSTFAARFTELVGEPPLQYLARWRMARAAELLEDRALGIGEIAGRVGYESVPSFTKAFKRWQGTSPSAFRQSVARP